jgi:hypothetical protein
MLKMSSRLAKELFKESYSRADKVLFVISLSIGPGSMAFMRMSLSLRVIEAERTRPPIALFDTQYESLFTLPLS